MSLLAILMLFAGLAWLIFASLRDRRLELERSAAIARVSRDLGWRFHGPAEDRGFDLRCPGFELFREGDDRYAHNRFEGSIAAFDLSLRAEAGDYHFITEEGAGKTRHEEIHRFSYLLVDLPFGAGLPSLVVRPEGLFDKFAGALGLGDIAFESAEFSRRFHVSGSDRRFAYALIDPRMIEFLLDVAPPRIELARGRLLIVAAQGRERWTPAEFAEAHAWTRNFLSRWPTYLVRDLPGAWPFPP